MAQAASKDLPSILKFSVMLWTVEPKAPFDERIGKVSEAAAKLEGVTKVLAADDASLDHQLAERSNRRVVAKQVYHLVSVVQARCPFVRHAVGA